MVAALDLTPFTDTIAVHSQPRAEQAATAFDQVQGYFYEYLKAP
jgi:hypothetical protein